MEPASRLVGLLISLIINSVGIGLLKVNNRSIRTSCEMCSMLTVKTPERRHWHRSGVFIVNFEHISYLVNADWEEL